MKNGILKFMEWYETRLIRLHAPLEIAFDVLYNMAKSLVRKTYYVPEGCFDQARLAFMSCYAKEAPERFTRWQKDLAELSKIAAKRMVEHKVISEERECYQSLILFFENKMDMEILNKIFPYLAIVSEEKVRQS